MLSRVTRKIKSCCCQQHGRWSPAPILLAQDAAPLQVFERETSHYKIPPLPWTVIFLRPSFAFTEQPQSRGLAYTCHSFHLERNDKQRTKFKTQFCYVAKTVEEKTLTICKPVADSWLENLVPLEWYKTASAKSILFTHLKFILSDAAAELKNYFS